ncbi:hypothetical protein PH210_05335 [Paenibacillus sp. BSR1-1]|uniref:hypothetical protein n=1 Tax=Paenibacillus sp. BSR1-1 TaxID=3020845 RepID=UPI0025AED872|nr:hypothetical protein [Paenibacillus sp. BSR1-1]MDN3015631.1 hypothetical protein [Paenibacillus sp. BSR1-1]
MKLNYERAKHLEGRVIRFRHENGEWVVGKVVSVKKDGLEIEELDSSYSNKGDGYAFPFFSPFFCPFKCFFFDPFFFFF